MAFCHKIVWIIILYIAFPKYVIFCWFFFKKSTVPWKTPKIWFWFKSSISWFSAVHIWTVFMRTKDQSMINYQLINYVKNWCIFVWFSRCTCAHKKMGTLVNSHTWSLHLLFPKFVAFSVSEKCQKLKGAMWWVP